MTVTDPIGDLLTRIRNAAQADHDYADVPASGFKTEIARILAEQGYIEGYETEAGGPGPVLRVRLKYTEDRKPVITGLERLSKPGRRRYVDAENIPRIFGGMGTAIISTSRGVMTGHDAHRARVGGELIERVW